MCATRPLRRGARDAPTFNEDESLDLLRYIEDLELIARECDLTIQDKIYYAKHYAKPKVVELWGHCVELQVEVAN